MTLPTKRRLKQIEVTATQTDADIVALELNDLADVTISEPANTEVLTYSTLAGGWAND